MKIYYLVSCYSGLKLLWQEPKKSLSSLARFVIDSEQYQEVSFGEASIIIEKINADFPEHNYTIDSFGISDPEAVHSIAKKV